MDQNYLIPANSKRSLLIFNTFRTADLIMFGVGVGISLILVMALPMDNILLTFAALSPALITGFLVTPIPNYHNILTIIVTAYKFFTTEQSYIWKGWCFKDGKDDK